MPCSRRARSTGRQCHHMPPTDPWRVRGVGMDPCPKHAQPLRRARARAAGRSLASASPQRMAAGPADRISDLHAQHHAALKGTARSSAPVCNAPASSRRCRPPLSSRKLRGSQVRCRGSPSAVARGEIDMAWSEVGGKWVKDAKRVDSRPTWSGWPLVAVPAARPAEVSGRRRRIDKIS